MTNDTTEHEDDGADGAIAIVGYSGRFPRSRTADEFWAHLLAGTELVERFDPAESQPLPGGVAPRSTSAGFVPVSADLDFCMEFDPDAFGLTRGKAAMLDPQIRLLYECTLETLEAAACDPTRFPGRIAVYSAVNAGAFDIITQLTAPVADRLAQGTAATKLAHHFGLRGEAIDVDTTCSTSLVAIHLACASLATGQSDLGIVAAANVHAFPKQGYVYQEGMIYSPDGHCRPFDAHAGGTIPGQGVVVLALKRLVDAVSDRDVIHGVILGSAINNDGGAKVGYTAPSIEGQREVIAEALEYSGVDASEIDYVEAHGTATALGDPIELRAITSAYRRYTAQKGYCGIGSLKSNLGHANMASGAVGLLKAMWVARESVIPPTLHFRTANAELQLEDSPFYVVAERTTLPRRERPRLTAVSSFGIGGTNAHAILSEPPPPGPSGRATRDAQLLVISARTEAALTEGERRLADRLASDLDLSLADVAHTLAVGRRQLEHRSFVVASTALQAAEKLRSGGAKRGTIGAHRVGFMFAGQGVEVARAARALRACEPAFRSAFDEAADAASGAKGAVLAALEEGAQEPTAPAVVLPLLAAYEHGVVSWLSQLGVTPELVLGHSFGEYVAASVAGMISLDELMRVAEERGRLMSQMPAGAMAAVAADASEIEPLLGPGVVVSGVNAKGRCTVSGSTSAIDEFEARARAARTSVVRLGTAHAFHSPDVEPLIPALRAAVERIRFGSMKVPFASGLVGTLVDAAVVGTPDYWTAQMRQPVRFADALDAAAAAGIDMVVEIGPARDLAGLAAAHFRGRQGPRAIAVGPTRRGAESDQHTLLEAVGKLWTAGVSVRIEQLQQGEQRRKVLLPTYAFQRVDCTPSFDFDGLIARLMGTSEHARARVGQAGRRADQEVPPPAGSRAMTKTEARLAALMAARVGVASAGPDDDFFELGGSSLDASQLVLAIQEEWAVSLTVRDAFEHGTPRLLAIRIEEELRKLGNDDLESALSRLEDLSDEELEGLDEDALAELLGDEGD